MRRPTGFQRAISTRSCGLALAVGLLAGVLLGNSTAASATTPNGPALQDCLTFSECPATDRVTLWDLQALRHDAAPRRQQVDARCVVEVSNSEGAMPYDVWQCATSWAVSSASASNATTTPRQWIADPRHIGFMGLRCVSSIPLTRRGAQPSDRGGSR